MPGFPHHSKWAGGLDSNIVWKILLICALIVIFIIVLVGCGDTTPPARQDLPEDNVVQDSEMRVVYLMPDTFPNVVAFCDLTTRIYITTRESVEPVVVPDHPACQEG